MALEPIYTFIISIVLSLLTTATIIGFSWGKLTQGLNELRDRFDKFDFKMDKLSEKVSYMEGRMGIGYIEPGSPLHLTNKGLEILVESGAKKIIDNEKNKRKIIDKIIKKSKPINAYDTQEKTKQVILGMVDNIMFAPLKEYAFEKGIDVKIVLNVTAIYSREFVLKELGFKSEDLDNIK